MYVSITKTVSFENLSPNWFDGQNVYNKIGEILN